MSTNIQVLPLLPSVMSMLHVRTFVGLISIAADSNLIILEKLQALFQVKKVLLCFANSVCLGIKFFFFVQIVPVT